MERGEVISLDTLVDNIDFSNYKKGLNEVKGNLEKFALEFKEKFNFNISFTDRIKSPESIKNKVFNKIDFENSDDFNDVSDIIYDIAGVRCVFSYHNCEECIRDLEIFILGWINKSKNNSFDWLLLRNDLILIFEYYGSNKYLQNFNYNNIYVFLDEFNKRFGYNFCREKDYIDNPKNSGYRGYHLSTRATNGVMVEIQCRTFLQHIWSELEHKFIYKKIIDFDSNTAEDIQMFFKNMAHYIDEISKIGGSDFLSFENFINDKVK